MQKSEIAQRLATANETERTNREAEIRLSSDLTNLKQQEQELLETMRNDFGVSTIEDLRQLYAKSSQEDERAVSEFEKVVNSRKELIDRVKTMVDRVNTQSRG